MKSKLAIASFIIPLVVVLFFPLGIYIIDLHLFYFILFASLALMTGFIFSLISFYLINKYKLEGKKYAIIGLILNLILFFVIVFFTLGLPSASGF